MENYSYNSYPESGDSSPRSREIEFENPSPWEDQQQPSNYKVRFMCSYGGKIQPRPHDNQLSYIGGETKILSVDRNIKFSNFTAKLSALCDSENISFKYQLPGEDLDALISVTNDDDIQHMMHEYDRMFRASPKPARLRLFLFPVNLPAAAPQNQSFGSNEVKTEKERFVEALNSGPLQTSPPPSTVTPSNNMDFLFGLERGMSQPPPVVARDPIMDSVIQEQEIPVAGIDDRVIGSDPIQKHIQDLRRLRIEEECMQKRKSDDNLAGVFPGEYYAPKVPEKLTPPVNIPGAMPVPTGHWPEKQVAGGVYPATTLGTDQPVYMIPAPGGMYHAPMGRQVTAPTGQGYYAVQRMPPEIYREKQVYNVVSRPSPTVPSVLPSVRATLPPQAAPKVAAYSEGMGMMSPTTGVGVGLVDAGYAQVAYDNGMGRKVFYAGPGGMMPPAQPQYQAAMATDMRRVGALNQEGGKVVVAKVSM